jgi:N-formylglutamate amidohydrolase
MSQIPFFVTMPHSGEKVPESCTWLKPLPETVLMCDVDRYIDVLYEPCLQNLKIKHHKTDWHRYAVDLNRIPDDVDETSVIGAKNPAGTFNRGFHWVVTTHNDQLMPRPMDLALHEELKKLIYDPFHEKIRSIYEEFTTQNFKSIYHLDAHSMPSVGTKMHKDPGEKRADIVISDSLGKSCSKKYRDLVIAAYATSGFKVGYNWPYVGGRLTEQYGQPSLGHHTIQVELNRDLYMDEKTKKLKDSHRDIQMKIAKALSYIQSELGAW